MHTICAISEIFSHVRLSSDHDWEIIEAKFLLGTQYNLIDLTSVAHSFALKKKGSGQFWGKLEERVYEVLTEVNPKLLATLSWSFGSMGKGDEKFW